MCRERFNQTWVGPPPDALAAPRDPDRCVSCRSLTVASPTALWSAIRHLRTDATGILNDKPIGPQFLLDRKFCGVGQRRTCGSVGILNHSR